MTPLPIADRTTSETVNADPDFLFNNLLTQLQAQAGWVAFYTDQYLSDQERQIRLVCGVTDLIAQIQGGYQMGYVVRIVEGRNMMANVFITTSYATPRHDMKFKVPSATHHDQIANVLLSFSTNRPIKRDGGVLGRLRRLLGEEDEKDKAK